MNHLKPAACAALLIVITSSLRAVSLPGPTPPSDTDIANTANTSYNFRVVLDGQVRASAKDGVVTLTGTVPAKDLKALAEDTVNAEPGVQRVDNQIKVATTTQEKADESIARKIRLQLAMRSHVSLANTTVRVKDGVVTLTGTADTDAQKDLTEFYAKQVDGVKSVVNGIIVKGAGPDATGHPAPMPPEPEVDDGSITTQIKYQLASYPSISSITVKVTTVNGAVVITGDAASSTEKTLVTKVAESIRGVKSVTNNMTVKP